MSTHQFSPHTKYEIVSSVAEVGGAIVALLGFIIVIIQLNAQSAQIKDQAEEARYNRAVDAVSNWAKNQDYIYTEIRRIAEKLSDAHLQRIRVGKAFSVSIDKDEGTADLVSYVLRREFPRIDDSLKDARDKKENLEVDAMQSMALRSMVTRYLNFVESALIPWQHERARQEIVHQQFKFLCNTPRIFTVLLSAEGKANYPATSKFMNSCAPARGEGP